MPRSRSLLRWLLPPLVLGAVTTVAVAWGIAAWLPQKNWSATMIRSLQAFKHSYVLDLTEYRTTGAVRRSWAREYPGANSFGAPFMFAIDIPSGTLKSDFTGTPLRAPRWGIAEALRADARAFAEDGMEHATGWPVLAGWYEVTATWATNTYQYDLDGGIQLETRPPTVPWGTYAYDFRALPLHPIWPGLLINTAFYAALWLLLFGTIRTARRARRRRRGRCPACAYDLSGLSLDAGNRLTCPECGRRCKSKSVPRPAIPAS